MYLNTFHINQALEEIFSEGAKSFFLNFPSVKCIFQVENSHFGRPKTNFGGFENCKAEKKKKKKNTQNKKQKTKTKKNKPNKKDLSSFRNFSSFHFQFSTFLFWFFLLFLPIFPFYLPSLFPVGQQKFSGEKCLGGTLPPAPGCYATDIMVQ